MTSRIITLLKSKTLYAIVVFAALVPPAGAQFTFSGLKLCTRIEEDASRLACFDRVTEELRNNANISDVVPDEAVDTTRQYSGPTQGPAPVYRAPQPASNFGLPARSSSPDEIEVNVVEAKLNMRGRWVMLTEDGQIWRQTSADKLRLAETPFKAQIEKGSLGSHWMEINKSSGVTKLKVTRTK